MHSKYRASSWPWAGANDGMVELAYMRCAAPSRSAQIVTAYLQTVKGLRRKNCALAVFLRLQ